MPSPPPPRGPYRDADRPEPLPPSPDIDPSVLAPSWTTPLLVVAGFWSPVWLLLTWLTDMNVRGCGPSHAQTVPEKVGVTVVLTVVFAVLVVFRIRYRRRQSKALRRLLHSDLEKAGPRIDVEPEDARVRVEPPLDASASAPEPAPSSEPASGSEPRRRHES